MGMKTYLVEVPDSVTATDIGRHLKQAMPQYVITVTESLPVKEPGRVLTGSFEEVLEERKKRMLFEV